MSYDISVSLLYCFSAQNMLPAATAAKSLQSCPTLCDPKHGSPPGSPVPGILQARTLELVAISFSNAWKWKLKEKLLSHVQLYATSWTAAPQAPLSKGFSEFGQSLDAGKDWRQEKGTTEDEIVGWHHWLNGREFEQVPWVGQRRQWHPPPVLLPGKSHERRSLVGYNPWGHSQTRLSDLTLRCLNGY